jgi:microcystin-dependent protein
MPYPGEIRLFAGNVPPGGWTFCHGQQLDMASAPALGAVLGARFGGDGDTTFGLPDLRGRVPVHRSAEIALGAEGGAEAVALQASDIPAHVHAIPVGNSGDVRATLRVLDGTLTNAGGRVVRLGDTNGAGAGTLHSNLQPYLCLNYVISLDANPSSIPWVGEVRMYAGTAIPDGWLRCDGQELAVADYTTLYGVIGTTYGGNGRETFTLPDLRGRVALQAGFRPGLTARRLGESDGEAVATLKPDQLPPHDHAVEIEVARGSARTLADRSGASNVALAAASNGREVTLTMSTVGGPGAHNNLQPYLAVNYLIACQGALPASA